MPPLPLTGERTLPDVPEENYWYRRHLAVYEWIAARVGGRRVVDMACGEGYGSDLLAARRRASVVGVDANPEAHEHARLRYRAPQPALRARPGRKLRRALRRGRLPADDRARAGPRRVLDHFKSMLAPGGVAYVSTPNLLTLAPEGAEKSDNPWHMHEYRADEFRALCEAPLPPGRAARPPPRPQAARPRLALRLGWDAVHRRLGLTKPFYDRFTPAIAASDFALRAGDLDRALDFLAVCHAR